ncbi:transcriptional regulator [Bacteroidia bacterium]|nr:transcriptional regulator [Bacteroidia bacterium]
MKYIEDILDELKQLINSRFDGIEKKVDRLIKIKDAMDGDKLLDNQDLCLLLGITKRSLARYRQKKLIRYYQVDRKTYYKASEIQEFLKRKGKSLE